MIYAIRNKRTKKWLFGTWWQDGRVIQRTSHEKVLTFDDYEDAKHELRTRRCGKDYEIVPVRIEQI